MAGEKSKKTWGKKTPATLLTRLIDKTVKNKFSIIQKKRDKKLEGGLSYWFGAR